MEGLSKLKYKESAKKKKKLSVKKTISYLD